MIPAEFTSALAAHTRFEPLTCAAGRRFTSTSMAIFSAVSAAATATIRRRFPWLKRLQEVAMSSASLSAGSNDNLRPIRQCRASSFPNLAASR
jgi:hypothetical protein